MDLRENDDAMKERLCILASDFRIVKSCLQSTRFTCSSYFRTRFIGSFLTALASCFVVGFYNFS